MVLREFNQPLREEDVPLPAIGSGDLLIKVQGCGVCYTDIKIASGFFTYITLPRIMGHEIAGVVARKGEGVKNFREGDRVCIYFYLNCGQCENCREHKENLCLNLRGRIGFHFDGGYAEYVKVPASHAFMVPPNIPIEEAAILADAVATPLHALREQAKVQPGETVAIFGVGGLGIHAVQLARLLGLRVLAIDLDEKKLQAARELGAETFSGADGGLRESVLSSTGGKGVDVVLDIVGKNETFQTSLSFLKAAGRYVIVGYSFEKPFTVSPHTILTNEFVLIGSRASRPCELADVLQWAADKKIKPMVSQRIPLNQANLVLERLKRNEIFHRVVLRP